MFSLRNGYTFVFEYDRHRIEAWFSVWSGAEKARIDGQLVAEQKTYSRRSMNTFVINGEEFCTKLVVESIFKGPFTCTLSRSGKPIKQQRLVIPQPKHSIPRFLFFIVLGGVFGACQSHFQFSWWYSLPFLVFIIALSFFGRERLQPVIEEVTSV